MRKYFYTDGTYNFGPFTLEELLRKKIDRKTLVWFHELGEWKPAGSIPELSEMFKFIPPPITPPPSNFNSIPNINNQNPPRTWLVESLLVTFFCFLPFGIIGIVNAANVESRFYAGDIEGANRAAENAKNWTIVSLCIGLGVWGTYFLVLILSAITKA